MVVILIALLNYSQPVVAEMSHFINCPDAQAVLSRIYGHKNLAPELKEELAQTVIDHMPINCPVPLQT